MLWILVIILFWRSWKEMNDGREFRGLLFFAIMVLLLVMEVFDVWEDVAPFFAF